MGARDGGEVKQLRSEIWRSLYDFVLREHERHITAVAKLGISPGDLKALLRLVPGEPASMRALADAWHCDASTATWIVDRLEKRALVERQAHPTDRRVKLVVLSREGEQLVARLQKELYQPPAVLSALSRADLEALRQVIARLP